MTAAELFDWVDTKHLGSELARLLWESLDAEVYLLAPDALSGGAEVRWCKDSWWLGRDGEEYWILHTDDLCERALIRKDRSEAKKAIWQSVDTEVFVVVRDIRGVREGEEPQLVRHWQSNKWLSLWHGVCEVWPANMIDDYELVCAAEWERSRREISYTQVQDRIFTRLRERGLHPLLAGDVGRNRGFQGDSEKLKDIWNTLLSWVYVWVRSCQIDGKEARVRVWQTDCWIMRHWCGFYQTVTTTELNAWGCLVRVDEWDRSDRGACLEQAVDHLDS
jgi:hypothetical protein